MGSWETTPVTMSHRLFIQCRISCGQSDLTQPEIHMAELLGGWSTVWGARAPKAGASGGLSPQAHGWLRPCISAEFDQFLSEPLISRQDDPASCWKMNMHRFPQLSAPPAQKFLAPPPTSVPSEKLFSTAGDIVSDHRCPLLPENAETLIFLKLNSHLLDVWHLN